MAKNVNPPTRRRAGKKNVNSRRKVALTNLLRLPRYGQAEHTERELREIATLKARIR